MPLVVMTGVSMLAVSALIVSLLVVLTPAVMKSVVVACLIPPKDQQLQAINFEKSCYIFCGIGT